MSAVKWLISSTGTVGVTVNRSGLLTDRIPLVASCQRTERGNTLETRILKTPPHAVHLFHESFQYIPMRKCGEEKEEWASVCLCPPAEP